MRRQKFARVIAYTMSMSMLIGSLSLTDAITVQAQTENIQQTISGNEIGGPTPTPSEEEIDGEMNPIPTEDPELLTVSGNSLFALQKDGDYTQFVQDEVLATFNLGTDITDQTVYNEALGYGFLDMEYNNPATGWSGGVYYPRTLSQGAPGASYVTNAEGALAISSKVWTETEETGYGVYTYENTSALSFDLANADYRIDVTLVNPTSAGYTAYLEAEDITKVTDIQVGAGQQANASFTAVLVDGSLDLKFLVASGASNANGAGLQTAYVSQITITRLATETAASKPTIYLASDSTVQTYESDYYPQAGWGETLAQFFGNDVVESECADCNYSQAQTYEADNAIVENRAIGGRSSKSFVEEGKLDDLLEDIKQGDFLFVQWGHNDATASRPNRYVSTNDFAEWLMYYINGALQRGATPVLVTPVARYSYTTKEDGTLDSFASNFEGYRQIMLQVAGQLGIPCIDLTARSIEVCNSFGIEGAKALFLQLAAGEYTGAYAGGVSDATHLQYYGAYKFAQCVAQGVLDSENGALSGLKNRVVMNIPENEPGVITGLASTTVGASSVSMVWDANTDAELYYIYRQKLEEGETMEDVDFTNAVKYSVSPLNKYTDSGCESGATYVYAVRGFNEKGLGDFSEKIEVTTKAAGYRFDFNYNGSPTMEGWTGVEYNLMYDAEVGYGWISSPGNGRYRSNNGKEDSSDMADDFNLGAGEFAVDLPNGDYEVTIYAGDLLDGTSTIKPSYMAEGLSIGSISTKQALGSCTSTVRVVDGQLNVTVGGSNLYINGMTITQLLAAPTGLNATEFNTDEATASVSFLIGFNTVKEAASYNVYCKNSTDDKYNVVKSFTAEQLLEQELDCRSMTGSLGENYQYYLTCVTSDGTESAPSNVLDVTLVEEGDPAAAPANLICVSPTEDTTELQRSISLKWDAVDGAIKYVVFRSEKAEDEKGFTGYVKVGESKTTTFTDTESVATNISYYYKVAAMTKTGLGEFSEICKTPITGSLVPGGREKYSNRAVVAMNLSGDKGAEVRVSATDAEGNELTRGVYLSWRSYEADMNGDNELNTTFTVYRNGAEIASNLKVTNLVDEGGSASDTYQVVGSNDRELGLRSETVSVWENQYLELNLYCPADDTMPDGSTCSYSANDMSLGDLDGDGELELIVKWYPSNAKDNSGSGYTGITYLDGYDVDFSTGAVSLMWRIDMGINIRSGAHYTQFQVWDYDGDGKAEIAVKTADGTTTFRSVDGTAGNMQETGYVGACNSAALPISRINDEHDYRNAGGYVLDGPEYFSMFNGEDGTLVGTVDYTPARGSVSAWGDAYGNRVDRFLSGTAYLDGETPFAVFCRGYYTRTCLTAYYLKDTDGDGIGDTLAEYWAFDTDVAGTQYEAEGNHGLGINDIDGDGKDEIIYGALVVDHDGTVKYATGLGHGDAMHISDWVSWNDGLEIMSVHEHDNVAYHVEMRDAQTGEILMGYNTGKDTGRGVAADIDPTAEGAEWWSIASPTYEDNDEPAWDSTNGEVYSSWSTMENLIKLSDSTPASNFSIFWDGDLLSEIQDHTFNSADYVPTGSVVSKWNYETEQQDRLLYSTAIWSNNGTKGNMGLVADFLGDWREEIVTRCADNQNKVRIYSTTIQTDYVIPCLLEDLAYREAVAWQNVGYNQPANTAYLQSKGLVTAQLSQGTVNHGSAEILFTPANDGDLYGHEITGYEIYRARGVGDYELIDTVPVEDLDIVNGQGKPSEPEDVIIGYEDGEVVGMYDFGNRNGTGTGYTSITNNTYNAEQGYGFTSANEVNYNRVGVAVTPADETAGGNALETSLTDLARADKELTFAVDLAAGTYRVEVYAGAGYSNSAYNGCSISVNEQDLGTVSQSTYAADMRKALELTLTEDGQITISSVNAVGMAILNAIVITKLEPVYAQGDKPEVEEAESITFSFDFGGVDGKNSSKVGPCMEGFTEITSATPSYEDSQLGYGLTAESLAGITFRYYAGATTTYPTTGYTDSYAALFDDCAMGWNSDVVFKVDLPNGKYDVTVLTSHVSGTTKNFIYVNNDEAHAARYANKYEANVLELTGENAVEVTDGVLTIRCAVADSTAFATILSGLEIRSVEIYQEEETPDMGEGMFYSYVDGSVASNATYSYKIAAVVDNKTSFKSKALTITTDVAIDQVDDIVLEDLVAGTPLAEGTTVADLLPATITVTDIEGERQQAAVTWDVSEVDINTPGEYKVYATMKGYNGRIEVGLKVVANQEKEITPFEDIVIIAGETVTLPEEATIVYTNTTTAQAAVTWDTEELDAQTEGEYVLEGTVTGSSLKATITVKVVANYITAIADIYVEADLYSDVADAMPAKVRAEYADGSMKEVSVDWNLEAVDTDVLGQTTVQGSIAGYEAGAKAYVQVVYPIVKRFDFGTAGSKTAEGWIGVSVNNRNESKPISNFGSEYTEEKGYGFADGTATFQGRVENYSMTGILPEDVYTDFALPAGNTFMVDVENGNYLVEIVSGSAYSSKVTANVEGSGLTVSNGAGTYNIGSVEVAVEDNQLTIEFTTGNVSRMNAVIIRNMDVEKEGEETPSPTPDVEESPSPSPTPDVEESPSPTPDVEESPSPTPDAEESPSPTPDVEESPSPTPTPDAEVSPSPTPDVDVTPSPTPDISGGGGNNNNNTQNGGNDNNTNHIDSTPDLTETPEIGTIRTPQRRPVIMPETTADNGRNENANQGSDEVAAGSVDDDADEDNLQADNSQETPETQDTQDTITLENEPVAAAPSVPETSGGINWWFVAGGAAILAVLLTLIRIRSKRKAE